MSSPARFGKRFFPLTVPAAVFLLLGLLLYLALTPYALREIWLPKAAKSAGAAARAEQIYLKSLIPFRIEAVNFHYAERDMTMEVRSFSAIISLNQLIRHSLELSDARFDGLRLQYSEPGKPGDPKQRKEIPVTGNNSPASVSPWSFAMRDFQIFNAVIMAQSAERKTRRIWTVKQMKGDQFRVGERCLLTAEAALRMFPDRRNPLDIRVMPFTIQAEYRPDPGLQMKDFSFSLRSGICDIFMAPDIVIPSQAGISLAVRLSGSFPDPETFRIVSSETRLYRGFEEIGKMQMTGEIGSRFQFEGTFSDLDMSPYLTILAPSSKARMEVPRAEFALTGSDFTPDGLHNDLKLHLIAEMKSISVPIELDRSSRLMKLIMIPINAMPTYLEMIKLKWNFRDELDQCARAVQAVISGRQNLAFDRARIDFSMGGGFLRVSDCTLHGSDISLESIRGTVELATEKIDLRTVIIINEIKLPLNFDGSLSQPSPRLKNMLKDFMSLNASLILKLEAMMKEPPSKKDSRLEKAIKRGYRNLNRYLK